MEQEEHLMARRELGPVDHLTADAVGIPGKRTFFLQAAGRTDQVTVLVEKAQIASLTERITAWLGTLDGTGEEEVEESLDMRLREPLVAEFRLGELRLSYDPPADRVVLVVVGAEDEDEDDISEVGMVVTRAQLRALAEHGGGAVGRGRPPCPLCGNPMSPGRHACPATNGHGRP